MALSQDVLFCRTKARPREKIAVQPSTTKVPPDFAVKKLREFNDNARLFLGLTLEVDIQQHEYINKLTQEAGAVLHISPRGDMPFPYEEGIDLAPGFSTSLGMRLIRIKRKDRFGNESCIATNKDSNVNLYARKFNTSYSTMACIQSCIASSQKSVCGCMEYKYYPKDKIVCDAFNTSTVFISTITQVDDVCKYLDEMSF
ncbi:Amiloride-sensitive sodium channel subunit beta [Exaiptasia diaphana]|nr:Amiloride-sensitive sodium channel subunit beta [Exaiptasia diaphana]